MRRKTELSEVLASQNEAEKIRKRTERELSGPDPEIPFYSAQDGQRRLVCSLMERDDRLYEDLHIRWSAMQRRMNELEDRFETLEKKRPGVAG